MLEIFFLSDPLCPGLPRVVFVDAKPYESVCGVTHSDVGGGGRGLWAGSRSLKCCITSRLHSCFRSDGDFQLMCIPCTVTA